jgi:hypothetical protein
MVSPGVSRVQKQKPPSLAVSKIRFMFCFVVNLPLLHRPRAGVAKVELEEKTQNRHGLLVISVKSGEDSPINHRIWQVTITFY